MTEAPVGAYVVDSSVVIRWYVDQVGFAHARQLQARALSGQVALLAPDILRWEVGDVLRKRAIPSGALDGEDIVRVLAGLEGLGLEIRSTPPDEVPLIARLAIKHNMSLFDAAFVFLSLQTGRRLVTADARLVRAAGPLISTELLRDIAASP